MTEYYRAVNINTTSLIKRLRGIFGGLFVNSGTASITVFDGTELAVAGVGTITSAGASAPADYAKQTLTSDTTAVADGDTVVLGATGGTPRTYRAKTTPIAIGDVAIGSTTDGSAFLANLKKAINGTGIGNGTDYFAGTLPAPEIIASTLTGSTLLLAFRTLGTGGNAYTTTEISSHLSFGAGTMTGGVTIAAATVTIDTITYMAVKTLAETIGLTAVANQVLWVTNEATFLGNLKKAINSAGTAGTDYSTGTAQHPTVIGTTLSATQLIVQAKVWGKNGNAIATTTTLANYSWSAATLASGAGPDATIILNTFVSVAATRYPVPPVAFTRGLYVVLSTTGDVSVFVD
jgi:hypothetical protein